MPNLLLKANVAKPPPPNNRAGCPLIGTIFWGPGGAHLLGHCPFNGPSTQNDHCTSHKAVECTAVLTKTDTVNVLIPKGCTSFVQCLDTHLFSLFKSLYGKCYNEFLLTPEREKLLIQI